MSKVYKLWMKEQVERGFITLLQLCLKGCAMHMFQNVSTFE